VTQSIVFVPDDSSFSLGLGAYLHTGANAVEAAMCVPPNLNVAIDTETPSVTDSFTIKCVTAAWEHRGDTHSVLLDPLRNAEHAAAVRVICERARSLILHNSAFDIPGLVAAGLLSLSQLSKIMDTLVFARSAYPDKLTPKGLDALCDRVLGVKSSKDAMAQARKAAGWPSTDAWFAKGDIDMPVYRTGAMADTVMTLRLAHPLYEAAVERQLAYPFSTYGHTSRDTAGELVMREQRVNRIMLRRAARGMEVDLDYLDSYVGLVEVEREQSAALLRSSGLRPGVGLDIVKYLDSTGDLPSAWPRTAKGTLKSDKDTMELLPDHPLAAAHRVISETGKILGYMEKVAARSRVTGRLHPQFNVLGASATGRFSVSEPELQQFSEMARPIIVCDEGSRGLQSIDYTSIEPALLGWMSRDWGFIEPFEKGADVYVPVMRSADCSRKIAKDVVLAGMYGQQKRSLAAKLGCSLDKAAQLQSQMRAAMPIGSAYMRKISKIAEDHALALTVSGRVLTIPKFNGVVAVHKAVNAVFQGSCADLIYEAIISAEKVGIGDHLMMLMHDEIICDVDAAEEMYRIMITPPPRLTEWVGRAPVLRCDSEFLGQSWKSC
jgi:DNA polymerase-1